MRCKRAGVAVLHSAGMICTRHRWPAGGPLWLTLLLLHPPLKLALATFKRSMLEAPHPNNALAGM